MPEPDFMHGTLDVWPVLDGEVLTSLYVVGDCSCKMHVGTTDGDIGIQVYVIGNICVDHHLCGKVEVNP